MKAKGKSKGHHKESTKRRAITRSRTRKKETPNRPIPSRIDHGG